jgi:hypothetical protein
MWRQGFSHEGKTIERRRLGAEHDGLRTRGLAVGSSQLPWAHIKLVVHLVLVKGLVGLGSGGVCSRGARSSSDRPIPRPGIVAPSAVRQRGVGGEDGPAASTDERPTARRNAGTSAGDTGVAAPSVGVPPKPPQPIMGNRMSRASLRTWDARVSAQPTIPDFSAAIVPAARSISRAPNEVPVSGFAAPAAVRLCGG